MTIMLHLTWIQSHSFDIHNKGGWSRVGLESKKHAVQQNPQEFYQDQSELGLTDSTLVLCSGGWRPKFIRYQTNLKHKISQKVLC